MYIYCIGPDRILKLAPYQIEGHTPRNVLIKIPIYTINFKKIVPPPLKCFNLKCINCLKCPKDMHSSL